MSIFLAILGLTLLIIVHELGHMWAARAFGMRVEAFSIFFDPPLLRWRGRRTNYQIGMIPLGGYVRIAGTNPTEQLAADDRGSYQSKSRLAQAITIGAGPAINYVFCFVLILAVLMIWGKPLHRIVIKPLKSSAALAAGLKDGDEIRSVDGKPLNHWDQLARAIHDSAGKSLTLGVLRGDKSLALAVAPKEKGGVYSLGISASIRFRFEPVPLGDAVSAAGTFCVTETKKILQFLGRLATGEISSKNVGGPVSIVKQLKTSVETSWATFIMLLALINVYLGLFNILPLPALDGGRLVFILIGAITRRSVNARVEQAVHSIGFIVLLGLLVLLTYKDIFN
ncbi:MAG: RIP metalloprotease RseP [Deltaproteobacteria bacterium]|nr:RIP metalloprotease RseP [Deltaproteobacteria bacterium]